MRGSCFMVLQSGLTYFPNKSIDNVFNGKQIVKICPTKRPKKHYKTNFLVTDIEYFYSIHSRTFFMSTLSPFVIIIDKITHSTNKDYPRYSNENIIPSIFDY